MILIQNSEGKVGVLNLRRKSMDDPRVQGHRGE